MPEPCKERARQLNEPKGVFQNTNVAQRNYETVKKNVKTFFKNVLTYVMCGVLALLAPLALSGCDLFTPTPEKGKAIDDYKFEELAQISQLIQKSDNPYKTAAEYGICDENGVINDQIKRFKLKDDTVCEVRVIGIMADTLSPEDADVDAASSADAAATSDSAADTGKKAGLTFMCAEVPAQTQYNVESTVNGGWEASNLRSYLNTTMMDNLPDYLKEKIVSVSKLSNNFGMTKNTENITATQDKLWEPSVAEVNGVIHWNEQEYYGSMAPYDTMLSSEGTQYQWFKQQMDANGTIPNDKLQMTFKGASTGWWYRSVFPLSTMYGGQPMAQYVMNSGYPQGRLFVTDTTGVAFGFCL